MIYLILSIILSTLIFVVFKLFKRFGINTFQAITFNYMVAAGFGFLFFSEGLSFAGIFDKPWLFMAIIEGILFIAVFVLFGISSQRAGVAVTAVASKMSVIIPVIAGILLYSDSVAVIKISGIILALLAFYLSTIKDKGSVHVKKYFIFPMLLFLGNGLVDAFMKVAEHYFVFEEKGNFISTLFFVAMLISISITSYKVSFLKEKILLKNALGGMLLGMINFLTSYCVILALAFMESSKFYPLRNAGIVSLSAIVGLVLFREKLSRINLIGIIISVLAIVLISLS